MKKSDHKHTYSPCKFRTKVNWSWSSRKYIDEHGEYCTICGKVGNVLAFYSREQVDWEEKHPNAPTFELEKFGQDYITNFKQEQSGD